MNDNDRPKTAAANADHLGPDDSNTGCQRRPPALIVRLELDARPTAYCHADTALDELQLFDYIGREPRLREALAVLGFAA